ncbi:GGDEF domain-containing protein [Marinobacter adhaerens]|uniref:diguanylate cyclase n=1 Tax=Marinobacter adhaerens TaxID=1033846 RepID=A0A851HTU8_9GAMM|nr:GGDEF domain-containing protein [Marinobacter adhaerens]NWN92443.1 GGDEF domain-containing protein [Marinobacter adhaerens]
MAQAADKFLLNRLSRASFAGFLVIATLMALLGEPLNAACAAAVAGLIVSGRSFHPGRTARPWPLIQKLFFAVFIFLITVSFWTGPWVLSHWLYGLVLISFALIPRAAAALTATAVLVLGITAATLAEGVTERHQMISALILTVFLSTVIIFLHEYKARQLAPLRRTDKLTQAASREYLSADLHREILRSEREGIDLSIIMIGLDTHTSDSPPDADIRSILPAVGRYLHSHIRDFDTYYRSADLQFLVILPGKATQTAATRAERIRKGLVALLNTHEINLTVSAGVVGLNIGDDAKSLQHSAAHALRRAQQQGGNQTQVYSNSASAPAQSYAQGALS